MRTTTRGVGCCTRRARHALPSWRKHASSTAWPSLRNSPPSRSPRRSKCGVLTHRTLGSTLHPPITSCPQDTSLLCSLKTVHEFFSVLEFRSHPALRDGDISAKDLFGWFSEVKGQGRRADEGAWDKLRDVIRVQLPNRTRPCICICMCDVGGFACMHVMLIPPVLASNAGLPVAQIDFTLAWLAGSDPR